MLETQINILMDKMKIYKITYYVNLVVGIVFGIVSLEIYCATALLVSAFTYLKIQEMAVDLKYKLELLDKKENKERMNDV